MLSSDDDIFASPVTHVLKMASQFHKILFVAGFISLFHAAYSAAQHRSFLRITEQEFIALPLDILSQGIASLFVTVYGIMQLAGDFKEIRATVELEAKSWDSLRNVPSFYTFAHRGRALSPHYVPPGPLRIEEH